MASTIRKLTHSLWHSQVEIQALYATHRVKRNAQQKEKFLSVDFKELVIDQYLLRLFSPAIQPGFRDERNCLVFWARPPEHIILLAAKVQQKLKQTAPGICPGSFYKRSHPV